MSQEIDRSSTRRPTKRRSLAGWRGSRTPQDSALFSRVLPAAIIFMAVVTALLVLFAVGVLIGVVPFQ